MSVLAVPAPIARCTCIPDDWLPCKSFECQCCGEHFEDPLPYAEPMDSPGLDLTEASAWFFYCQPCAFEWIRDGADVRRVVALASEAA